MIPTKIGPSIIYKERLHKPRLPMNAERLDKKSDQLLDVLNRIDESVSTSSEAILNIHSALTDQACRIDSINNTHLVSIEKLKNDMEKNTNEWLRTIQSLNANFCIFFENVAKKMDAIMEKLSEFDVAEETDIAKNEMDEIDEVPEDWISDDEMHEDKIFVEQTDALNTNFNAAQHDEKNTTLFECADEESDGD
jgi:hypothetical protein